jgi:hypothetical protein
LYEYDIEKIEILFYGISFWDYIGYIASMSSPRDSDAAGAGVSMEDESTIVAASSEQYVQPMAAGGSSSADTSLPNQDSLPNEPTDSSLLYSIEHMENGQPRLVLTGIQGMMLECCHFVSSANFCSGDGKCPACNSSISQSDANMLLLAPLQTSAPANNQPTIAVRLLSLHGQQVGSNTDEQSFENPTCVCAHGFDQVQIVVLPCGHPCCKGCLEQPPFQNTLKCYTCREQSIRLHRPYRQIVPVSTPFAEAVESGFAYFSGPLTLNGFVYNETPEEVLTIQSLRGMIVHPRTVVWMFSTREVLIVRLAPGTVAVLHRWVDIPRRFIEQITVAREESQASAMTMRQVSGRTYTQQEVEYEQPPAPVQISVQMSFQPYVDGPPQLFRSQTGVQQRNEIRDQIQAVALVRDSWMAGLESSPVTIEAGQSVMLNNSSPFVFRNAFNTSGGTFYDYVRFIVQIVAGRIVKHMVYVYNRNLGVHDGIVVYTAIHTGDSHPYVHNPDLYVHEIITATEAITVREENRMNNATLVTHAEMCARFTALGYTHIIDCGAAWGGGILRLYNTRGCRPSIILHTGDDANAPVAYPINPFTHLETSAVVLGITPLQLTGPMSEYRVLGWGISGNADSPDVMLSHIDRHLSSHPEALVAYVPAEAEISVEGVAPGAVVHDEIHVDMDEEV